MGIVTPLGSELPNTDAAYKAIADAVDAAAAMFGQGTLAARPVSTPGSPGKAGRFYVVTSGAESGQVYYDYGTGWFYVNPPPTTPGPDSITATEIAANAVGSSELADNSVDAAAIQDGVVGAAKIANALKPSAGAGAGTEALRAIGSGAGQVVAGNDARLTDQRVPTDNSVTTGKVVDANITLAKLAANSVDDSKIVAGHGGAGDYSAGLPVSGLFTGYRHTIFIINLAYDLIYRPDLDATYPWQVAGGPTLRASGTSLNYIPAAWGGGFSLAAPVPGRYNIFIEASGNPVQGVGDTIRAVVAGSEVQRNSGLYYGNNHARIVYTATATALAQGSVVAVEQISNATDGQHVIGSIHLELVRVG